MHSQSQTLTGVNLARRAAVRVNNLVVARLGLLFWVFSFRLIQ